MSKMCKVVVSEVLFANQVAILIFYDLPSE